MITAYENITFPIDLVYLWVDDTDEAWSTKRKLYRPAAQRTNSADAVSTARWRNNDELRYSLRSVEMYAPWVNHIYIITDNQRPSWLVADHPKVTIVDHKDILPAEALPVFNSQAIESCIHKIEALSEHFIVANDDTLFAQPVEPTLFFQPDGRPIVRLMRFNRRKALRRGMYHRTVRRMQDLVRIDTGVLIPLAPHHNLDAYRKSDFAHCVECHYPDLWAETSTQRFRNEEDMQRCFVSYWMVATGAATMRKVGRYNRVEGGIIGRMKAFLKGSFANDSRVISANLPDYEKAMRKYNPLMICANDNERATDDDCARLREFLRARYCEKSSFEV